MVANNIIVFFKFLVSLWADSLKFFYPSNLKQFLLLTFKSTFELYRTIFRNFAFFLLACLSPVLLIIVVNEASSYFYGTKYFTIFGAVALILLSIQVCYLISFVILAARPSVNLKNFGYFLSYIGVIYSIYLFLIFIITANIPPEVPLFRNLLFPEYILCSLFLFDARYNVKSIIESFFRTILFLAYNLPIIFIFKQILLLLFWVSPLSIILSIVIASFVLPFYISLITNYYTKKIHEQFYLYYRK